MVGLVCITTLATALSLFMPLSLGAISLVGLGALGIAFWLSRQHALHIPFVKPSWPALVWALAVLVGLSLVENVTHLPVNPDSGIYHAQTIRWIETYPAVPGLGNLHGRLAFNSSWLVVSALFSFAFLNIQSFHLLPGVLALVILWMGVKSAANWLQGHFTLADLFKILLVPVTFTVVGNELSSPGTDLPAIILAWLIVIAWLEREEHPEQSQYYDLLIFVLAIFAVTVKLTAFPLLLFAGLVWLRTLKPNLWWKWLILAAGLCLPWLVRNMILSGYLAYPIPGLPGFGLDWQIPQAVVREENRAILAWGRLPGMDRDQVLAFPFWEWQKLWFQNLTLNRKAIFLIAMISPLLIAVEARWQSGKKLISTAALLIVTIFFYSGTIFWWLTAPDFRFGYGYLMALFCLPLIIPLASLSKQPSRFAKVLPVLVIGLLVVYQAYLLGKGFDRQSFTQRLVIPMDYRVLPTEPCAIKNSTILCAAKESWKECWYAPFPCVPEAQPNVELRGESLQDGFRVVH